MKHIKSFGKNYEFEMNTDIYSYELQLCLCNFDHIYRQDWRIFVDGYQRPSIVVVFSNVYLTHA